MRSIGDVPYAWECVDTLSVGVICMFGDHYYSSHWDIIACGMIEIRLERNYLFRKVQQHHHYSVRKVASGSVEENATLRV